MLELPDRLFQHSTLPEAQAIRRALTLLAEILPAIYDENSQNHKERDNAQVYGLRNWVHIWAVLKERESDLRGASVEEENSTFYLRVGSLKIGIHKLGHVVDDDIHACFPDGSPTQREYARNNAKQLTLFDASPGPWLDDDRRFACRELTVGHFGNPDEGLVKWYVGAYVFDERGRPRWAWVERQPLAMVPKRPDVTPYDQRPVEEIQVRPRRQPVVEDAASEGTSA